MGDMTKYLRHAPLTELLATDKKVIFYRPILAEITGKVTSAILLQQVHQYASGKDYRPFYKFRAPCKHPLYREEDKDSWLERLRFSPAEFDCALRAIGTKITQGTSKKDAFAGNDAKSLVIYWTDSDRVTWYVLNVPLLERMLQSVLEKREREREERRNLNTS